MITHPGIGRYIKSIIPALMRQNRGLELVLLGDKAVIEKLLGFETDVIDFNYPIYSIQEQIGFLRIKKIIGANLFHVPHYNVPFLARFNLIVTIHDIIHITYPQGASNRLASFYMHLALRRAIACAKKIICVSAATEKSIQQFFRTKVYQLEVIGEGVSDFFSLTPDITQLQYIKNKYNLPDKFILYVGSIRKHKNITSLVSAFLELKKTIPALTLVLVGRSSQGLRIKEESVIYLGEISDEDLACVYNLASVLCNVSLYEGFNLTILEAQKCKLPVVCSDIPTHRETAGLSATFVPATGVDQIKEALYNVITKNDLKTSLVNAGLANVARFDWNLAASKTFEVYKNANFVD